MKLFVFDVDGTLVGDSGVLNKETISSLNKILKNGDAIAIASGRPFAGIIQFLDLLEGKNKFVICANGAEVRNINKEILFLADLKYSDYLTFLRNHEEFLSENESANAYIYLSDSVGYLKYDETIKGESECNGDFPAVDLNTLKLKDEDSILKFMVASNEEVSLKFEKDITEEEFSKYKVVRSSPVYVEFVNKNTDKSVGVEFLRKYLSVKNDDVYTFGDSGNDVEMLQNYHGIAMGNAIEACKKVSKFTTKSVDENGVSFALKVLNLI